LIEKKKRGHKFFEPMIIHNFSKENKPTKSEENMNIYEAKGGATHDDSVFFVGKFGWDEEW
jgi:hypothetical protein